MRQIDLEVHDREFLVLVGPSGCGKSTTLRMIAGLEEPDEGEIYIGDRPVSGVPPKDRDVAMVFQNYALYPHMNVYQNMAFGLQLRYGSGLLRRLFWRLVRPAWAAELSRRQEMIDRRVRETAKSLELDGLLERMPADLSGGERQRVALGRAIVREPAVFLFDEPLSNLDAKLRVQMRLEIKNLQQELGITSVYVTHDQVEAMTLGDQLAVLNGGYVEQLGTPIEIYERPASTFVASFIGSPSMNLIEGQMNGDATALTLPGGSVITLAKPRPTLAGRPATLGIRPEHFGLGDSENGENTLPLHVQVVEQLGADTLVHGHLGDTSTPLVLRLDGVQTLNRGGIVALHIPQDALHIFDPQTGKRVD